MATKNCYKCQSGWCQVHGVDDSVKYAGIPGDQVTIAGKRYTLLEKNAENLWLVIETDNPVAAPVLKALK